MNIYDFAIDFEIENREFYEECAAETSHEDLKQVFLELAKEEKKHENIVISIQGDLKIKFSSCVKLSPFEIISHKRKNTFNWCR